MRTMKFLTGLCLATLLLIWHVPAHAQQSTGPQHIQALIASGQENTALAELQSVLQAHPDSGVAWYLEAEAQDAAGNLTAARSALAKAEQYSPGLPFAQADKVAALKAHLAGPALQTGSGFSPTILFIVAVVALFLIIRMVLRSRRRIQPFGYPNSFGPGGTGPQNPPPYGPGGMNYGGGMPGMGSSLLTGLAAGAGFAAGERIIDGMMSGPQNGGNIVDPAFGSSPVPAPDRDDGLLGSPGWGDNNSAPDDDSLNGGGNFDPGNNW